ncbi:phosphoribosyltransferase [Actinomycetota bacterium]
MRFAPREFADRKDAGHRLAAALGHVRDRNPLVIGLPRGGVVVAAVVAQALDAELDILVVRKIGAPGQSELGLGAIAEGGVLLLNQPLMDRLGVTREDLQPTIDRSRAELARRRALYRGDAEPIDVAGRTVVLVDDGLATGGTAKAAIDTLRHLGAGSIVVAVPVGAPSTIGDLEELVEEVVCLSAPRTLMAIGQHYADFTQTSDEEVLTLLAR